MAFRFIDELPNFLCDQVTFRYTSDKLKPDWKLKDRVDAELVYVNGKEDYRRLRINSKPIKKGSPEDTGTWSTGEFGATIGGLFSSNTQPLFKLRGPSNASNTPTVTYDYTVAQANSQWLIRIDGDVKPAYKGAVWIDPKSGYTLRIEMNSRQLPAGYKVDTVESVVEYDWVAISGKRFLLPVRSENLTCQRGTFYCTRNTIEFRNYRKFNVESTVLATDSEISFPEAEDDKPAPKTTPPAITPPAAKKKP